LKKEIFSLICEEGRKGELLKVTKTTHLVAMYYICFMVGQKENSHEGECYMA